MTVRELIARLHEFDGETEISSLEYEEGAARPFIYEPSVRIQDVLVDWKKCDQCNGTGLASKPYKVRVHWFSRVKRLPDTFQEMTECKACRGRTVVGITRSMLIVGP